MLLYGEGALVLNVGESALVLICRNAHWCTCFGQGALMLVSGEVVFLNLIERSGKFKTFRRSRKFSNYALVLFVRFWAHPCAMTHVHQ